MPNRILREGILTSPRMSKLGWPEEVFYRRLMSAVDDFGRYFADPGLLRGHLYPRQLSKVSDADIVKWLHACEAAGLVSVYPASDGERYLELLDFRQQVRAKGSKYPARDEQLICKCTADAGHETSSGEANAPVFVSVFGVEDDSMAGRPAGDGFEVFYAAYPRKEKPRDARKAWDKLKPDVSLQARILKAIEQQRGCAKWLKEGGQFIPLPATWLNAGEWDNQPVELVAPRSDAAEQTRRMLDEHALTPEQRAAASAVRARVMANRPVKVIS